MEQNGAVVKVIISPSDDDGKCFITIDANNKSIDMVQIRALARFTRAINEERDKMILETEWIDERVEKSTADNALNTEGEKQ